MKVMKLSVFVFVFAILAAVFVSCWSGDTDEEALLLPKPQPDFRGFYLELTWPTQFCANRNCKPSPPTQKYFTIHGLWPRNTPAGSDNGCATTEVFDKSKLTPMKDNLLKYWPDLLNAKSFDKSVDFWKYEWEKHGTCSSNKYSVKDYFGKALALGQKYSTQIYQALIDKGVKPDGKQYRESDILCAIRQSIGVEPLLATDGQALAGIRLCVKDDAVTLHDCYAGKKLTFAAPRSQSRGRCHLSWRPSTMRCNRVLAIIHDSAIL